MEPWTRRSKEDPYIRDGKKTSGSGWSSLPYFVLNVLIGLPVFVMILLPLSILMIPYNRMKKKKSPLKCDLLPPPSSSDVTPRVKREYDLVIFGATGFTGGLAAEHMAKTYGTKTFAWAIAGRNQKKLEAVRKNLATINPECADVPILIADTSDVESVRRVVNATRSIATTVGPFARYGSQVVQLCAQYGTDYADTTGETDWVRVMIDLFDDTARESGARIVHFCGHDCIPWDLNTQMVAEKMKANGENLTKVEHFDNFSASASGGTLETAFMSMEGRKKYKSQLGFDPLFSNKGTQSDSKLKVRNQGVRPTFSKAAKTWVSMGVMSSVMANCVKRSNALLAYGTTPVYYEASVFPNFMACFNYFFTLLMLGTSFSNPPLAWFLRKFVLPKPGQGPTREAMKNGFLEVLTIGTSNTGSQYEAVFYCPADPGYLDTARMCVESALTLASGVVSTPGGVLTPAPAMGHELLDRLMKTGTDFYVKSC